MSAFGIGASDRPALIDGASGDVTTYADLVKTARDLVGSVGTEKRLVCLLSHNDVLSATAFAAARLGGHAIVILDGDRDPADHLPVIEALRPDWLVGSSGVAESLAAAGVGVERTIGFAGGELIGVIAGDRPPIDPDLAVLLSTSGTTGSRRFVRLSTRNVESNAAAIATYLGLDAAERPVASLPFHYTFGLSVLASHLVAGAAVVVTSESVVRGSFWDVVRAHRCTSVAGVPYTFQILERIGYRDMDLPAVRVMQQAGGALDRELTRTYAEHMAAKGGRLFVMYGQTEATARMAYVPPERLLERLGSAGVPIPGGRFRIDGDDVGPEGRRVGEVVYEGPNVMQGYASSREDLARGDELDGVLRTGDIGYLDDGYLFLVGRSKRIAKVFGLRVNLDEVERMLEGSGPVAVVGGDDAIWAYCAFGTDESLKALGDGLARRLRLHRSSVRLRRVDDLPTSSSGKVDYREVERWTSR